MEETKMKGYTIKVYRHDKDTRGHLFTFKSKEAAIAYLKKPYNKGIKLKHPGQKKPVINLKDKSYFSLIIGRR